MIKHPLKYDGKLWKKIALAIAWIPKGDKTWLEA
jgi:hypothetical protein